MPTTVRRWVEETEPNLVTLLRHFLMITIDQLGGWSLQSVGQGYGDGYPLITQHNCLKQICD